MAQKDLLELKKFLAPFPSEIQKKALWLRQFVWRLYPQTNELIYDNYNALAFGWSPTDRVSHTFCSIAIGRTSLNVHFGFYWGSKIKDPDKKLLGAGNQYRYYLVNKTKEFPIEYITKLINEAYNYSLTLVKDPKQLMQSKTIVKSISAAKRTKKKK